MILFVVVIALVRVLCCWCGVCDVVGVVMRLLVLGLVWFAVVLLLGLGCCVELLLVLSCVVVCCYVYVCWGVLFGCCGM